MPWTDPITFYDGDPLTAAQLNTFIRDNLLETAPAKATREGRLITTASIHSVAERQWARDVKTDSINVENQWFVSEDEDGTPYGPTCTVAHGGALLIFYDALITVTAGNGNAVYAPGVNGNAPEHTNYALRSARDATLRTGSVYYVELEPGVAEVSMYYGTSNQTTTARYDERRLTVIAF